MPNKLLTINVNILLGLLGCNYYNNRYVAYSTDCNFISYVDVVYDPCPSINASHPVKVLELKYVEFKMSTFTFVNATDG